MREWGADALELPGTREAARAHVALPMGKDLTREQVEEVIRACASGST
jgi:dTDP-4-amino-4,6-dideoxygalactose transaminase